MVCFHQGIRLLSLILKQDIYYFFPASISITRRGGTNAYLQLSLGNMKFKLHTPKKKMKRKAA
jgi:hypothetical protein